VNWEAIGAIGQAVSASALVVVIVQVRLSSAEALRSLRETRIADHRRGLMDHAQSEWLSRVVWKGHQAYGLELPYQVELMKRGLAPEEALAFGAWMQSWWVFDSQQIAHIGQLSKGERAAFDATMRAMYQSKWKSDFFEMNRSLLSPDAVRYIDYLLGQPS
jgi:hypothetical protein